VRLEFAVNWPWVAVLGLLVAAAGFVFFFYRVVLRTLRGRRAWLLVGMRLTAVVLLFLLIFRPVLSYERQYREKLRLLFAVDTSASMSILDYANQPDRLSRVVERLRGLSRDYGDDFEARYVAFDSSARPVESARGLLDLRPEGKATHLGRGLAAALAGQPKQDVAAFFLLSDGQDNSADDPVQAAVAAEVPVMAVGVGTKLRQEGSFRDLLVEKVECPPRVTVNNVAVVDAFIESVGLPDRVVDVRLMQEEQVLATQRLVLDNKEGAQKVSLEFTPRQTGQFTYAVALPLDDAERIRENNAQTFTVTVTDPKIKVLFIEGVIRNEYRELRRVWETDPNVELLAFVQVESGAFLQQGNIRGVALTGFPREKKEMEMFDVFVIGDLDRTFFTAQQVGLLKDVVADGKGFLMLGGYHSLGPGGYERSPVEEILPVFVGARNIGQEKDPFVPKLTDAGMVHPIFEGIQEFFATPAGAAKRDLSPLRGCVVTAGPQPGAVVLAVHPARRDPSGAWLTLAAVKPFGEGRTMVFTADTTWQWVVPMRALGRDSPYVRFWGQAVRWLASKELKQRATKPGVEALADKTYYRPGESVALSAEVRAEEGRATNRARTTATVTLPNGTTTSLPLPYRPGTTGEYTASFTPPEPGDYQVVVAALNPETNALYGQAEVRFQVGRPNLEFDRLDLNEALLRRLAQETGGRYLDLYDVATVIQDLRRARREKTAAVRLNFIPERHVPWTFALFVLIITVEWIVRKRYQLS
jgi:uncharacterized membrane protein